MGGTSVGFGRRLSLLLAWAVIFLWHLDEAAAQESGISAFAGDVGRAVARELSPFQLTGLIALGFLPAFYMIVRARRAVVRHR